MKKHYISADQLKELAKPLAKNQYGQYLLKILDKKNQAFWPIFLA